MHVKAANACRRDGEELKVKCKNAKTNVEELERLGCIVVHGVNVHSMSIDCRVVGTILYDRIIFNFSHTQETPKTGGRSARVMLKDQYGEIHVTHKMVHSFKEWRILVLGYTNKRGGGSDYDSSFPVGQASTFMFRKF
ncbi:ATP-binding protein [Arabidopsis thaliana]|uniref:ATP-binding protein n=1 Tax=Arabidopsis thaliana TaxID=3702 RepID=A0A1P8B158_ARATH|nr:ATP-binding protein [Arabidopsis thaliana]ANM62634.1 ATP-binding protein [Arabidopsis thaliana]|eukprot:NP_001324777.1 ATP-binding protein [Arabidopsis thaliana]